MRRQEIIAATLRVVERDGVAGVTHRSVAREAGVPASSAVYYFATLDDLLVAALTASAQDYADQLCRIAESGTDSLDYMVGLIADTTASTRRRALAEYELILLAVRRPALRPIARRCTELMMDAVRAHSADPVAVRAVTAVIDGLWQQALLAEEPIDPEEVRAVLRHTLGR